MKIQKPSNDIIKHFIMYAALVIMKNPMIYFDKMCTIRIMLLIILINLQCFRLIFIQIVFAARIIVVFGQFIICINIFIGLINIACVMRINVMAGRMIQQVMEINVNTHWIVGLDFNWMFARTDQVGFVLFHGLCQWPGIVMNFGDLIIVVVFAWMIES